MKYLSYFFILSLLVMTRATNADVRVLSTDELRSVLAGLQHTPYTSGAQIQAAAFWTDRVAKFNLQLPVHDATTQQIRQLNVPVYLPTKMQGQAFPIVLISATIQGTTNFEKTLAYRLNTLGFGAAILDVNSFEYGAGREGLRKIYQDSVFAVHAFRTMIDWIESKPDLPDFDFVDHPHPVVAFGASNGTLTVVAATAVDLRIEASVIVAGIGDIPNVYVESQLPKIQHMRNQTMQVEGLTADQLPNFFKQNLFADPLHVAHLISPTRILQIIATEDTTVPSKDQFALWQALGQPQKIEMKTDHVGAIFSSVGIGLLGRFFGGRVTLKSNFKSISSFFQSSLGWEAPSCSMVLD